VFFEADHSDEIVYCLVIENSAEFFYFWVVSDFPELGYQIGVLYAIQPRR